MANRQCFQRWIAIILFMTILVIDWCYTYALMQEMSIITHWVVLSPVLMTLFMILGFLSAIGLYLHQWWGFVSSYLLLILSTYFSFLSFSSHFSYSLFYIFVLITANLAVFVYIAIYEIVSWDEPPTDL